MKKKTRNKEIVLDSNARQNLQMQTQNLQTNLQNPNNGYYFNFNLSNKKRNQTTYNYIYFDKLDVVVLRKNDLFD